MRDNIFGQKAFPGPSAYRRGLGSWYDAPLAVVTAGVSDVVEEAKSGDVVELVLDSATGGLYNASKNITEVSWDATKAVAGRGASATSSKAATDKAAAAQAEADRIAAENRAAAQAAREAAAADKRLRQAKEAKAYAEARKARLAEQAAKLREAAARDAAKSRFVPNAAAGGAVPWGWIAVGAGALIGIYLLRG